jgi:hypothetical protein
MKKSYADYLRENGASDDDIKAMDTPIGRKAYEKMVADADAAAARAATAEESVKKHQEWYSDEAVPAYKDMETKMLQAQSEKARVDALLKAAQERGMIDIALLEGHTPAPPAPTGGGGAPPDFDPKKYNLVTNDTLLSVAEREGDAIAIASDIAFEHSQLFPNNPLKFRELRREAVAAKKSVEQLWMEKYGVVAAREAKAKAEKEAYEKRLREEGAAAERTRIADQYANPETRPLATSNSPFAPRPKGDEREGKQPWDSSTDLSVSRVQNATKKLMEKHSQIQ